jgi:hypothetical protein
MPGHHAAVRRCDEVERGWAVSTADPDGKIAAVHRRALVSVVSVVEGLQRLQSFGNVVMATGGDPKLAKKAIATFREYSEACVESGAAVRQYCDHMEPLLDGEDGK